MKKKLVVFAIVIALIISFIVVRIMAAICSAQIVFAAITGFPVMIVATTVFIIVAVIVYFPVYKLLRRHSMKRAL